MSLWEDLAEHHVLIVPGTIFSAASVGQDLVESYNGNRRRINP
jgi:hypothetical protein